MAAWALMQRAAVPCRQLQLQCAGAGLPDLGRAAALGLAAFLLGGALVALLQWPLLQDEVWAQRQRAADLLAAQQSARKTLAGFEAALAGRPAQAPASHASGPPAPPAPPLVELHRWALASGLQVEQLRLVEVPGSKPDGAPPLQIHSRLKGRYHQHGEFAASLAGSPTPARLVSVSLLPGEAGPPVATLVLEMPPALWTPQQDGSPSTKVRYSLAPRVDPFSAPSAEATLPELPPHFQRETGRPPGLLEQTPLGDLELVGTLQAGAHWLALVKRESAIHTVREGDFLGERRARVRRIGEHGLRLGELVRDDRGRWVEQERRWPVGSTGDKP